MENVQASWEKHRATDEWRVVVVGNVPTPGAEVTVTARSGRQTAVRVAAVMEHGTNVNGTVWATCTIEPRAPRASTRAARAASTPTVAAPRVAPVVAAAPVASAAPVVVAPRTRQGFPPRQRTAAPSPAIIDVVCDVAPADCGGASFDF